MTERLAQLLREEASALDVPPPPAGQVMGRARGLRRRRRLTTAATGLVVVVAIAATAVVVDGWQGSEDRSRLPGDLVVADPAGAAEAFQAQGAFAVGRDLHIGPNRFTWKEPIKAIYYTSAGVVVRSGDNDDPDEGGSNYTLVTPTGEPSDIDVGLDDQVPGFEPDSAHLAYTDLTSDGTVEVVVHDVATDRELARVPIEGEYDGGWLAPPAAIDGDVVWVRNVGGEGVIEVDWRTGRSRPVPGTEGTYEIANGVYADWRDQRWVIRSMADSEVVRELGLRRGWYGFLSPNGRSLRAFPNEVRGDGPVAYEIFDVATGEKRELSTEQAGDDLGWTPDGRVLRVDGDEVSVCQPLVDECRTTSYDLGDGTIRIGGEPYGS